MRRGGRRDDDVARRQVRLDVLEIDRLTAEALRKLLCAVVRAVGYEDLLDSRIVEMLSGQLADLAGAQKKRAQAAHFAEDLPRQLHRGVWNRDGVLTDAGIRTHLLGNMHRLFEEPLQQRIERTRSLCCQKRGANLAADLRLADDHRIEP